MMYKAKVAVCSDIRAKHSTQSERHVEFLNVKTWRYGEEPLGVKRLKSDISWYFADFGAGSASTNLNLMLQQ